MILSTDQANSYRLLFAKLLIRNLAGSQECECNCQAHSTDRPNVQGFFNSDALSVRSLANSLVCTRPITFKEHWMYTRY